MEWVISEFKDANRTRPCYTLGLTFLSWSSMIRELTGADIGYWNSVNNSVKFEEAHMSGKRVI